MKLFLFLIFLIFISLNANAERWISIGKVTKNSSVNLFLDTESWETLYVDNNDPSNIVQLVTIKHNLPSTKYDFYFITNYQIYCDKLEVLPLFTTIYERNGSMSNSYLSDRGILIARDNNFPSDLVNTLCGWDSSSVREHIDFMDHQGTPLTELKRSPPLTPYQKQELNKVIESFDETIDQMLDDLEKKYGNPAAK